MRTALCMLVIVFSMVADATTPWEVRNSRRTVTVDYLYEACSDIGTTAKGDIPYFDCESYVYGVVDAYVKVRESIPKAQRSCVPPDIEPWRVLQMADPKPGTYPRAESAGSFLIDFLKKRYPCS